MTRAQSTIYFTSLLSVLCAGSASAQVNVDTTPIHRLVLEIATCDISNAGTDDKVWISINGNPEVGLNLGSERNRGDVDAYDILRYVPTSMASFTSFQIRKDGTDRWNTCGLTLHANDAPTPIFSAGAFTLNGNGGFVNSKLFTNFHGSSWTNASSAVGALPNTIANLTLVNIFETAIGDELARSAPMSWGDRDGAAYVEIGAYSSNTFSVDYDLHDKNAGQFGGGREVDYDERYTVSCAGGHVSVSRTFSDVDCNGVSCYLGDNGFANLQHGVSRWIAAIEARNLHCSSVVVDGSGNIVIVP